MEKKYPEFCSFWFLTGLFFAFLLGFNTAAHMSFVLAFEFPVGPSFRPVAQLHGHVQLLGWTAFFIFGVSIYFLPRQASAPIGEKKKFQWLVFSLLTLGLLARIASHTLFAILPKSSLPYLTYLSFFGSLLEFLAILLVLGFYLFVFHRRTPSQSTTLPPLYPLLGLVLLGFLLYGGVHLFLTFQLLGKTTRLLPHKLLQIANNIYLLWVLLPICFAFSLRLLPLYLRLPSPQWWKGWMGCFYLPLALLSTLGEELHWEALHHLGGMGRALFFLAFTLGLDVLTRFRSPWVEASPVKRKDREKKARPKYPDYGEFGHFEWYIYTAYASLVFAALLEIANGVAFFLRHSSLLPWDVVRHIYFLGFVSFLIFGVGARMLPGLSGQKALRWPKLSDFTFFLLLLALLGRVFHISFVQLFQLDFSLFRYLFGLSGLFGMVATLFFFINLAGTFWQRKKKNGTLP